METTVEKKVREFKPGRFNDISLEEYHKMKGFSKSALDHIDRSMLHYFDYLKGGSEQAKAMLFGSAFHSALLTPDLFEKEYFSLPKLDMRKKECKELYAELCVENVGKQPVSEDDYESIQVMVDRIMNHPTAPEFFKDGEPENSFFWNEETTDIMCKCRPDFLPNNDNIVIEVKTCQDASFKEFQKTIVNRRYHVQAAMFVDGVSLAISEQPRDFFIVAIESAPPYAIAIYDMRDCISLGRASYQMTLNRIKKYYKAVDNGEEVYPGYNKNIQQMALPGWAKIGGAEFLI